MKPPVFILSTGRTGSTLVQRILNSYPDVTIWGEHKGFLSSVAEAYFSLLENPDSSKFLYANRCDGASFTRVQLAEAKAPQNWQAWMNWFSPADVTRLFRNFVLSFFKPSLIDEGNVWGFKEIRYGANDRVVEFLAQTFPEAVFVFLVRSGFDTVSSQIMAWQPTGRLRSVRLDRTIPGRRLLSYARNWVTQNRTFLNMHSSGRIQSFFVRFEELARGEPVLEPLLQAIGKSWGAEQQTVLDMNEGRESAFNDQHNLQHRSQCLGGLTLLAVSWIIGELNAELGYPTPERLSWANRFRRSRGALSPESSGPSRTGVTESSEERYLAATAGSTER